MFQPLSKNCGALPNQTMSEWPAASAHVVHLPLMAKTNPRPTFIPPAIPKDLSERLMKVYDSPILWWVSEMLKYIFRETTETEEMFKQIEQNIGFVKPIVGIHVRRTDKKSEAPYRSVEEYMKYVVEYFEHLELKEGKKLETKRVYVASDDPSILGECQKKFPGYFFNQKIYFLQIRLLVSIP